MKTYEKMRDVEIAKVVRAGYKAPPLTLSQLLKKFTYHKPKRKTKWFKKAVKG